MKVVFKEDIKGYSFGVLKSFKKDDIVNSEELDDILFDAWTKRGVIKEVVEKVEVKVEKVEKPKKPKAKIKPSNKKVKKETVEEK